MGDDAVGSAALGHRHLPVVGGGLHQHHAGGGAALAYIVLRLAYSAAAAGGVITPHAVARQVFPRRGVFGRDFGPVAFQFFRDQLRQTGQTALAHFRTRNAYHHGVVWFDHHPGIDFRRGGICSKGAA